MYLIIVLKSLLNSFISIFQNNFFVNFLNFFWTPHSALPVFRTAQEFKLKNTVIIKIPIETVNFYCYWCYDDDDD